MMNILSDVVSSNGANGSREVTLEGRSLKRVVARYPNGDELDIQNGVDGEVVLTLVPPFQDVVPYYPELASDLAPLYVTDESVDGALRTIVLSPRGNLIQRFAYLRVVVSATARLQVETGYGGNPFSVRLRAA